MHEFMLRAAERVVQVAAAAGTQLHGRCRQVHARSALNLLDMPCPEPTLGAQSCERTRRRKERWENRQRQPRSEVLPDLPGEEAGDSTMVLGGVAWGQQRSWTRRTRQELEDHWEAVEHAVQGREPQLLMAQELLGGDAMRAQHNFIGVPFKAALYFGKHVRGCDPDLC